MGLCPFLKNLSIPQKTAHLVTFTEEILNGKLHFLCSDMIKHTQTVNQISELLEG